MTDEFVNAAVAYVGLAREIKEAERKLSAANNNLSNLHQKQYYAAKVLQGFVGNNVRRKAVLVDSGGTIVTVEHGHGVTVYENGEELR